MPDRVRIIIDLGDDAHDELEEILSQLTSIGLDPKIEVNGEIIE